MTGKRLATEVVWNDFYALELPEIDAQHQTLFSIINDLWMAVMAKNEAIGIEAILDRLEAYALIHFSAEEALMRDINYPRLDEHKRAHQRFVEQVVAAKEHWRAGEPIGFAMLDFLNGWLVDHILTVDKDYAAHYARSGQPLSLLAQFFPGE